MLEFTAVGRNMDIIAQLQEQAMTIAQIAFDTIGSIQRDAPPARLSQNYPEPPAPTAEALTQAKEGPKIASAAFTKAVKQFDALVGALPVSEEAEETQVKRIAELQAENERVGKELQHELNAAGQRCSPPLCQGNWLEDRKAYVAISTRLVHHSPAANVTCCLSATVNRKLILSTEGN